MSGDVNVSGTITTGNSCSLKYWKVTGTSLSTIGQVKVGLPTGCIHANIVGMFGYIDYIGFKLPLGQNGVLPDTSFATRFHSEANGSGITVYNSSSLLLSSNFTIIVVTLA